MSKNALTVHAFHEKPCTILTAGDRSAALKGILDTRLKTKMFKAKDYAFGFEFASPKDVNSLGESMIIGGQCYTYSTDEASLDYLNTIHGPKFYASATLLFPKDIRPNGTVKTNKNLRLRDFYNELISEVDFPTIGFIGLAKFKSVCLSTIVKPPIEGVALSENKNYYVPFPGRVTKNTFGVLGGVAHLEGDSEILNKRFRNVISEYADSEDVEISHDPDRTNTKEPQGRSRFLRMRKHTYDYNYVSPEDVLSVKYVYMRDSILSEFKGDYFLINDIENLLD